MTKNGTLNKQDILDKTSHPELDKKLSNLEIKKC